MSTWPHTSMAPGDNQPQATGAASKANGATIAPHISARGRSRCPRSHIHTAMATTMSVTIETVIHVVSPRRSGCPAAAAPRSHKGASTAMPTSITTIISA